MAKLDLALVVRTVDQATRPLKRIQKSVRAVGRQTGLDPALGAKLAKSAAECVAHGPGGCGVWPEDGDRRARGRRRHLAAFAGRFGAAGEDLQNTAEDSA